jgi:hypothetical protein
MSVTIINAYSFKHYKQFLTIIDAIIYVFKFAHMKVICYEDDHMSIKYAQEKNWKLVLMKRCTTKDMVMDAELCIVFGSTFDVALQNLLSYTKNTQLHVITCLF